MSNRTDPISCNNIEIAIMKFKLLKKLCETYRVNTVVAASSIRIIFTTSNTLDHMNFGRVQKIVPNTLDNGRALRRGHLYSTL